MSMVKLRNRLLAMRRELDEALEEIAKLPRPKRDYEEGVVVVNFGGFGRYADWRRLRHAGGIWWEDQGLNKWCYDSTRPIDRRRSCPKAMRQYRKRQA